MASASGAVRIANCSGFYGDRLSAMREMLTGGDVYYLTGETREQLEGSPYLESFRAKGQDVLFLTDPVDEFMVPSLASYKEKPLKAVDRADVSDGTVDAAASERRRQLGTAAE